MGSVIPDVKGALEGLFEGSSDLEGVLIVRGAADRERSVDELVVGNAKFTHEWRGLGNTHALSETFTITITVSAVVNGATDYTVPEERLWDLVAIVEALLAANTRAGGAMFQKASTGEQSYFLVDKGKGAQVALTLEGKAQITN